MEEKRETGEMRLTTVIGDRLLPDSRKVTMMINRFKRMFDHARWADMKLLEALQGIQARSGEDGPGIPDKAMRWFAHVLASEQAWLARLNGRDSRSLPIWPDWSLAECEGLAKDIHDGYAAFLEGLQEDNLNATVTYQNQTGNTYTTGIADILTHISMHGAYHRGQIASNLREAGFEPVGTDFILFVREGN